MEYTDVLVRNVLNILPQMMLKSISIGKDLSEIIGFGKSWGGT